MNTLRLVLHMTLDDVPRGDVAAEDGTARPFIGWIGLLQAVGQALAQEPRP